MQYGYQTVPNATVVPDDDGKGEKSTYGSVVVANAKVEEEWTKGVLQPPAYRDVGFSIAFWMQFTLLVVLGIGYASGLIPTDPDFFGNDISDGQGTTRRLTTRLLKSKTTTTEPEEGFDDIDMSPLLWPTIFSLIFAPILAVVAFSLMSKHAAKLIELSITFAIMMNVLLAIMCIVSGAIFACIFPVLGAIFTCCYARYIWHRIPYAAANLKTAIASIQSQLGVAFLGIAAVPIYMLFFVWWIYVFVMTLSTPFMQSQVQTVQVEKDCDLAVNSTPAKDSTSTCQEEVEVYTTLGWTVIFLFLLSLYWTIQVIGNTIQSAVAGSVGTWWFVPQEAKGCCSPGLTSSLFRSLTYSFGSICFGSLIVAVIQTLKAMVQSAANNRDNNRDCGALLYCIAQCLLDLIEQLARYFNKWAFIYVGLYGYPYIESGKNVISLFEHRGWTTIISDDLTSRALGMMTFAIGLAVATGGAVIGAFSSAGFAFGGFIISLILGMSLTSIIFGVVNSCVATVIVLFAEAPTEFLSAHPDLATEMNTAWNQAWPDIFSPAAPTMVV